MKESKQPVQPKRSFSWLAFVMFIIPALLLILLVFLSWWNPFESLLKYGCYDNDIADLFSNNVCY